MFQTVTVPNLSTCFGLIFSQDLRGFYKISQIALHYNEGILKHCQEEIGKNYS